MGKREWPPNAVDVAKGSQRLLGTLPAESVEAKRAARQKQRREALDKQLELLAAECEEATYARLLELLIDVARDWGCSEHARENAGGSAEDVEHDKQRVEIVRKALERFLSPDARWEAER